MKKGLVTLTSIALLSFVFLLMPFSACAYEFKQATGIQVEVLPAQEFLASFGNNQDIPLTHNSIIALASKLYPPEGKRPPVEKVEVEEECREYEVGLLFAALQNPAISDTTRQAVDRLISQNVPLLPRTYTSGHFKFFFTSTNANPDHNVTLAEVQSTATYLNSYWNTLETIWGG